MQKYLKMQAHQGRHIAGSKLDMPATEMQQHTACCIKILEKDAGTGGSWLLRCSKAWLVKYLQARSHHSGLEIEDGIPAESCVGRQSSQHVELQVVGLRVEQDVQRYLCLHQQGMTGRTADTLAGFE